MKPETKTKLECAVYAVLTAACLTACGTMFQAPPVASPIGSAGDSATTKPAAPANPAASTAPRASVGGSQLSDLPDDGSIPFEKLEFQLAEVDPEKPLPHQENLRIDTQAELDAFLNELGAGRSGRPKVDFDHMQVLAFYDKGGGNGCDERQLEKIDIKADVIDYVYGSENELRPGPDKICTMVLILPHYDLYAMVKYDTPVKNFKDYTAK